MKCFDPKRPFQRPWPVLHPKDWRECIACYLDDYRGTAYLQLQCPSQQKRTLSAWCEFFQKATPIRQLALIMRTPMPLFEAVCKQKQLTALHLYGAIEDLSPISKLKKIDRLYLRLQRITDLRPISALTKLEHLYLGNFTKLTDYSPLAKLKNLLYLQIEGLPFAPKSVYADNLEFIRSLKKLRGLSICDLRFPEKNYWEPILDLKKLEYLELFKLDEKARQRLLGGLPSLKYGYVVRPGEPRMPQPA